MKIDNSVKNVGTAVSAGNTRQRADSVSAPESSPAPSAQVQISALSSRALADAPVTNPARIAEIKQAIAEGRFSVNAEKIADGLLDNVRQLLGKSASNA